MTAIPQAYDITLTQEDQEVLFGFLEAILLAKLTEPSELHDYLAITAFKINQYCLILIISHISEKCPPRNLL